MTERNSKIVYTIHLALILVFIVCGAMSIVYFRELARAKAAARSVLLGLALFWFWRTVWQIAYFKPSKNRRLRKFLYMHYALVVWFFTIFVLYFLPGVLI